MTSQVHVEFISAANKLGHHCAYLSLLKNALCAVHTVIRVHMCGGSIVYIIHIRAQTACTAQCTCTSIQKSKCTHTNTHIHACTTQPPVRPGHFEVISRISTR